MPPTLSAISPSQGPTTGGTTVTLTGAGLTGATSVRFGKTPASFTVNSATQITAVTPADSAGPVAVTVISPSGTSNAVTFTYVAAAVPVVTAVAPNNGPTSGGTSVTITGTGFTGATAVRFADLPAASFTVNSATQITAVTPADSAGPVAVTVISPSGTSNAVTFTYVAAAVPVVTAVAPNNGPTSGGTSVTITGTGFTGATAVRFADLPAASFTVNSATQITAVTPSGNPGGAAVTVTTPGGTSVVSATSYFFYAAPPVLTDASPAQGPTSGGTVVTLTGSSLLNASAVRFGVTNATSFTVVSSTQITATAPPGTGSTQITVVTPGGTSNPLPFAYIPAPTLTGLAPVSGPTSAGTVVTLTGTNLATATKVTFGATLAAFTVVSDTQITATAPAGAAGPVSVSVTTAGGPSAGLIYTRVAAPGI